MAADDSRALPGSNLRWYLNRLRCMQPAEIPFRVRRALAARVERLRPRRYAVPEPDLSRIGARWVDQRPAVQVKPYLDEAARIAAGRLDIFSLHDVDVGDPPRWNTDPKTGTTAPLTFGKLLDYRNPALVGDIKYLWEPNRHLQLVTLAQAWALSGEARYCDALFQQLRSWFAACPCPYGVNWSSALEPAMRLLNWSVAWQLLGGPHSEVFASPAGRELRSEWLRSVHQHVTFIRGFHSFHSSANNHLIGEAAGIFVAAATWPHWNEAASWLRDAQALLVREALLQNAPDGVNREQAMSYQQYELDLLLLPWLAGRAAGAPFPAPYTARLEAMLEYLASVMDAGGHVPMFGDSDDARAVRLSVAEDFCPYRSLLATGVVLFGRADLRLRTVRLDDKTRWLCGPEAEQRFREASGGTGHVPMRRAFTEGGYYILGSDFDTSSEVKLVADAGPLGYGSLAAHGHADALSFTLSLGGHEMLVDPGTFTYRADSPWRAYFRGTSAHNTLRVDRLDQSEAGGSFLWLSRAEAGCSRWSSGPDEDVFEGWHNGYQRLADPVLHRRRIAFEKAHRRFIIDDTLQMKQGHAVELFFHFHERCFVHAAEGSIFAERNGQVLRLRLPQVAGGGSRICKGQTAPPLGWISRRFDERQAAPTLVWSARVPAGALLRTVLEF